MKRYEKLEKLLKDSDQELANELSQEIKKDALDNARNFEQLDNNIEKGKSTAELKDNNFLKKEAELID